VHVVVGEVLGDAEDPVAGVGHDDVDAGMGVERLVDDGTQPRRVGDVERSQPEPVAVAIDEVGECSRVAGGRRHAISAGEQLLGEFAPHSAGCACDEPGLGCLGCHVGLFLCSESFVRCNGHRAGVDPCVR
jgi:hypothetical protein